MDEAEYLTSNSPSEMLTFLMRENTVGPWNSAPIPTARQLRLWCIACAGYRGFGNYKLKNETADLYEREGYGTLGSSTITDREWARWWCQADPYDGGGSVEASTLEQRAGLLREIFGNPFQPIQRFYYTQPTCAYCGHHVLLYADGDDFACKACYRRQLWPQTTLDKWLTWNDNAVQHLAEHIYQDRAWGDMLMLHDALLDAGCDDENILLHCRGVKKCLTCARKPDEKNHPPGMMFVGWGRGWQTCSRCEGTQTVPTDTPHIRGCWVVDLLREM